MVTIVNHQEFVYRLAKEKDENILYDFSIIKHKVTFNFDEAFDKGFTSSKLKKRTTEFLNFLP